METTTKTFKCLTAGDVMTSDVIRLPEGTSLRDAAKLLLQNQISGAPVVDANGRCIGVLSATDFIHWAEEGAKGLEDGPLAACRYQVKGRLLTGEEAVICILAPGSCPRQEIRPTTGGRHTAVCLLPTGALPDWQKVSNDLPVSAVRRYMTSDIVTVGPETPLTKLARIMIDAHIHRVIVVDEGEKPIGIVSSTDILAAVARSSDD
jgi:CBS domain-containing protein